MSEYLSPFSGFNDSGHGFMAYDGSLAAVLNDLETGATRERVALHPPRIIRAIVDYKISNPNTPGILPLLQEAIQLGLDFYLNGIVGEEICRFRQRVVGLTGDYSLLDAPLKQASDPATWNAMEPAKSRQTAANVLHRTDCGDILFIALGHGGVAAGMDVYLNCLNFTGNSNSKFYVARFSIHKLRDNIPRLTMEEIQYLRAQAIRRSIVVFDEDISTGTTMDRAGRFFKNLVFPDQPVVSLVTNYAINKTEAKVLKDLDQKKLIMNQGKENPLIFPQTKKLNYNYSPLT